MTSDSLWERLAEEIELCERLAERLAEELELDEPDKNGVATQARRSVGYVDLERDEPLVTFRREEGLTIPAFTPRDAEGE